MCFQKIHKSFLNNDKANSLQELSLCLGYRFIRFKRLPFKEATFSTRVTEWRIINWPTYPTLGVLWSALVQQFNDHNKTGWPIFRVVTYLKEQHEAHPLVVRIVLLLLRAVVLIRYTWMRHLFADLQTIIHLSFAWDNSKSETLW